MSGLFRILKTERFNLVFSFILGFALVSLFKPLCKGDACKIGKPPPMTEIEGATYQLGSSCYQFKMKSMECPSEGVIEPFLVAPFGPMPKGQKRSSL